jgi:F-type H+-transporting ATPase subunit b
LAAQESTPAATSEAASPANPDAAKPESDEEKQVNAFRLEGPVVKATAKALNIPVNTAATLFEFLNFAIIVVGVGYPLFKFLPKTLTGRKKALGESIDTARKATEEANSRLSAIEAKLASMDAEVAKFRDEVEREAKDDEARIKASLEEESVRIVQAAEQEIASAAAVARRGLRNFAADLAIDHASRQLNLTPEADRALIAEFAGGMAAGEKKQGGQN